MQSYSEDRQMAANAVSYSECNGAGKQGAAVKDSGLSGPVRRANTSPCAWSPNGPAAMTVDSTPRRSGARALVRDCASFRCFGA
jgi:hypothetical protein